MSSKCHCENCQWFVQDPEYMLKGDGLCMCGPPTPDKEDRPHFPKVGKNMTCGQWCDREDGNTPKFNFYIKFLKKHRII